MTPEQHAATVEGLADTVRHSMLYLASQSEAAEIDGDLPEQHGLAALDELVALAGRADEYRVEADHSHDDYEDAEEIIRRIAEMRPNHVFDPWARDLCREFLDRPRRSRETIADIRRGAEAAEARPDELQRERDEARDMLRWRIERYKQARREADQLRAALRPFVEHLNPDALMQGDVWPERFREYQRIARAALAGVQAEEPTT